jgi:hypothetical protein
MAVNAVSERRAAPVPISAGLQPLVDPAASTMVSASTASTKEAKKAEIKVVDAPTIIRVKIKAYPLSGDQPNYEAEDIGMLA